MQELRQYVFKGRMIIVTFSFVYNFNFTYLFIYLLFSFTSCILNEYSLPLRLFYVVKLYFYFCPLFLTFSIVLGEELDKMFDDIAKVN